MHLSHEFWMLQVRKSCFCGTSATFFQCCFMNETQVLTTISNSFLFFSRNHFLKEGFTFQRGVGVKEGARGGGGHGRASALMGGGFKKSWDRGVPPPCPLPPHYGAEEIVLYLINLFKQLCVNLVVHLVLIVLIAIRYISCSSEENSRFDYFLFQPLFRPLRQETYEAIEIYDCFKFNKI